MNKIRYDVSEPAILGSTRFDDLKEAFAMAKIIAKDKGKEIILRKLVWDDTNRIIESATVMVNAEGHFRYI